MSNLSTDLGGGEAEFNDSDEPDNEGTVTYSLFILYLLSFIDLPSLRALAVYFIVFDATSYFSTLHNRL